MPPELVTAIVGAVIAAVVAMGAAAALIPPFMKKQMEIYQQQQQSKILSEQQRSQDALDEAKQERESAAEQRKQFGKLIDTLINERVGATQQQEVMVRALTSSVSVLDGMAKELRANTGVTTDISKTMAELGISFKELLEQGSQPLQRLSKKVDEMGAGMAAMVLNQRDTTEKVNYIHGKIEEIVTIKNYLDVMLKVAEAKLEDVKKGTGEIPAAVPS